MNGLLLDTHVWFWTLGAVENSLRDADRERIEAAARSKTLYLSAMSIWETAQKEASGRLGISVEMLIAASVTEGSVRLIDISVAVLIAANRLPGKIHGDPVDRLLAATARDLDLTLVTHDKELIRYGHQGHLRVHKV